MARKRRIRESVKRGLQKGQKLRIRVATPSACYSQRDSFESSEGVRLPRDGLTSGEIRGTSGEVRGTSGKFGKLPGTCIALQIHSERSSGEVAEKLPGISGKSRELPQARGSLTPSRRLAKIVSITGPETSKLTKVVNNSCTLS